MPKIHYTRFPVTSRKRGSCGLVADLLARQQVRNKLATSRCNGILETTRHNRHNGLLPAPTCYGLTDLSFMLRTCCGLHKWLVGKLELNLSAHIKSVFALPCEILVFRIESKVGLDGASDSNSRHTAPPINVFDIDIDIDEEMLTSHQHMSHWIHGLFKVTSAFISNAGLLQAPI